MRGSSTRCKSVPGRCVVVVVFSAFLDSSSDCVSEEERLSKGLKSSERVYREEVEFISG